MTKDEMTPASCLGMVLYAIVSIPVSLVVYGYTVATMWRWFIEPMFNLRAPSIGYAIGLLTTIRLVTYQSSADKEQTESDSAWQTLITSTLKIFLMCGLSLGFGWVVKHFV